MVTECIGFLDVNLFVLNITLANVQHNTCLQESTTAPPHFHVFYRRAS